jgi:RNA polymerase sigma-54 factor
MALEIKQGLKTTQKISLSLELKNSITILTLGRFELEKFIHQELDKNPCLIHLPQKKENRNTQSYEELKKILQKSFNQNDDFSQHHDLQRNEEKFLNSAENFFQHPFLALSLHGFLEEQILILRLSPYEKKCVFTVLQYIDDSGFLNTDLKAISMQTALQEDDLAFALKVIQSCEPTGVGAQTLQECLLLQAKKIDKKPKYLENILTKYWLEFQKQDFLKIARQEKVNVEEIKNVFRFIRANFDPKPARQFGSHVAQIIVPDVFVFKRDNQWICSLNENGLPRLKLSKKYSDLIKNFKDKDKEAYKYISENLKAAKWLVRALQERDKTILKVVDVIIKHQKKFFEQGVHFLAPLTLKVVAQELDLHESTISRATSDKFLYSPRGIFELKYFFNSALENKQGNELANETIKQLVAEFIKDENKKKPLSDQEITNKIERESGIKIARRTVSKYRELLGILSSSKRAKKF